MTKTPGFPGSHGGPLGKIWDKILENWRNATKTLILLGESQYVTAGHGRKPVRNLKGSGRDLKET